MSTPKDFTLREQAKAVTGGVLAGLTALGTALAPDQFGVVAVTPGEWVAVAVAALGVYAAVFGVRNA